MGQQVHPLRNTQERGLTFFFLSVLQFSDFSFSIGCLSALQSNAVTSLVSQFQPETALANITVSGGIIQFPYIAHSFRSWTETAVLLL